MILLRTRGAHQFAKRYCASTLVATLLIAMAVVMLFPYLWLGLAAFKEGRDIIAIPVNWWPTTWTTAGFERIWRGTNLPRAYLNSLIVSAVAVASVLFTSSLGGYTFGRLYFPGVRQLFYFVLATTMVPFVTLLIPLYVVLYRLHLVDTYVGLWLPLGVSSFGIFLCRQFIYSIPSDLFDAAKIDGASDWIIYVRIVVPLIKPALAVVGIFTFLLSFNAYLWPLVAVNEQDLYTLPLVLARLSSAYYGSDYQVMMAGSLLTSIPTVAAFILLQRQIVRGIALGGMKF